MRPWILVLGLIAATVSGCAPSPERVCTKMMDMQGGFTDEAQRKAGFKYCVELKTAQQKTDPKRYACEADCVVSERNLVAASECNAKCGPAK